MSDATARVREILKMHGVTGEVRNFPQSTRTAEDAARTLGTSVAQIVKSLVFIADGRPLLVLCSGANRVDVRKVAVAAGAASVEKADAAFVRRATGFSIGGVPPVGHASLLSVFVDRDLLAYDVVYAAAGTPNAVFPIAPDELVAITRGVVADVAETA